MPFPVQCDGCSKRFAAPDSYRGKMTACPSCGQQIRCGGPQPSTQPQPESKPRPSASTGSIFDLDDVDATDDLEVFDDDLGGEEIDLHAHTPFSETSLSQPKAKRRERSRKHSIEFAPNGIIPFILPVLVVIVTFSLFRTLPTAGQSEAPQNVTHFLRYSGWAMIFAGMIASGLGLAKAALGSGEVLEFIDKKFAGGLAFAVAGGFSLLHLYGVCLLFPQREMIVNVLSLVMFFVTLTVTLVLAFGVWKVGVSKFGGVSLMIVAIPTLLLFTVLKPTDDSDSFASGPSHTQSRQPPAFDLPQSPSTTRSTASGFSGPMPTLPPMLRIGTGVKKATTNIPWEHGSMRIAIYVPSERTSEKLPVVLVAPAGAFPLTGQTLGTGDSKECTPFVRAGFIVANYEISGKLFSDRPSPSQLRRAIQEFKLAEGGVKNAKAAIKFIQERIPYADMDRVYTSGHSSAGTASLLVAAHCREVKGCIAFAAVSDLQGGMEPSAMSIYNAADSDLTETMRNLSPYTHVDKIRVPTFLFHDRLDRVVDFGQSAAMASALPQSEFVNVSQSNHYDSMISTGLPKAVNWLTKLDEPNRVANKTPSASSVRQDQVADRGNDTGSSESDASKSSSTFAAANRARDRSRASRPSRRRPPSSFMVDDDVKLGRSYQNARDAAIDQLAFLAGRPGDLSRRLRLWKAGKRPSIGMRFGINVVGTNGLNFASVLQDFGLGHLDSEIGILGRLFENWMISAETRRITQDWPDTIFDSPSSFQLIIDYSDKEEIIEKAKEQNLQAVISIVLTQRIVRGQTRGSYQVSITDATGKIEDWQSKLVPANSSVDRFNQSIFEPLKEHLRDNYATVKMPALNASKATKRATSVKRSRENQIWVVLELLHYYNEEWITQDVAVESLNRIAPQLDAETAITGSPGQRYYVVKEWLISSGF